MTAARAHHSRSTKLLAVAHRRVSVIVLTAAVLLSATPVQATAVTRDTVMARAQRWVDLRIPYGWSLYFNDLGQPATSQTGWRADCSGYVSMSWWLTAWGRPSSPDTSRLPGYGVPILKHELLPGDAIIKPKTATTSGHAALFGGWTSSARTHYWAFEESSSQSGTVRRITPYPYWNGGVGYQPYRYRGIGDDYSDVIIRVQGDDRYASASQASRQAFPDPVSALVVASGEDFPDALGGAALAGAVGGPVLLTRPTSLPNEIHVEISRLKPSRIFVLGGSSAVSDTVLSVLGDTQQFPSVTAVVRIPGADRYETAANVARVVAEERARVGLPATDMAFVATGENYPDALAASAYSWAAARPVVLATSSGVPTATIDALIEAGISEIQLIGGEKVLSEDVRTQLREVGLTVDRVSGSDRYSTALALSRNAVAERVLTRSGIGIASGEGFADALSGGPAQGALGSVLLLTAPDRLPATVAAELLAHRAEIGRARCYGGDAVIRDGARAGIAASLRVE